MRNVPIGDDSRHHEDNSSSNPDPCCKSMRKRHHYTRYLAHEYILLTNSGESECYDKAMKDVHKEKWMDAMKNEMKSLHGNQTFELVKLPQGKKALKNKWDFRVKHDENSSNQGTKLGWL